MPFVITSTCVDVTDRSCLEECPVDCIYVGERKLYIHPGECIDCGACEPACPVEAIWHVDAVPAEEAWSVGDSERFFDRPLPGRDRPVGSPGGASDHGEVGVDTEQVAALPGA